jgi:HEAT repeat protein
MAWVSVSHAITLLAATTLALAFGLVLLVVGRKAKRDRRERASLRLRRRYAHVVVCGSPARLRALLATVRGTQAQLDLARALEGVVAELPPERRAILAQQARRSRLLARLGRQCRSRDGIDRGRAVMLVSRMQLPSGPPLLRRMLEDRDPDVRLAAADGLALFQDEAAVRALVSALGNSRLATERVVERLDGPWAVEPLLAILAELRAQDPDAVGPRVGVIRALGLIGDPRAEGVLVEVFAAGGVEERISAARALGSAGGKASVGPLARALDDEEWTVRAQACRALGQIGDERAVPGLAAHLGDRGWWVRANAAEALRRLGEPGLQALRDALVHPDRYARDRAREALALEGVTRDGATVWPVAAGAGGNPGDDGRGGSGCASGAASGSDAAPGVGVLTLARPTATGQSRPPAPALGGRRRPHAPTQAGSAA